MQAHIVYSQRVDRKLTDHHMFRPQLTSYCAGSEYEEDEEGQEFEDDAENDSGRANRR